MRFWLKEEERKPDPVPAKTDDRLAVMVGLTAWLLALAALLIWPIPGFTDTNFGLWTCVAGIAIGLFGLV
ncbi:MAG: DUF2530 domain-containing protein, partial [Microbacteriaceae bacterium]